MLWSARRHGPDTVAQGSVTHHSSGVRWTIKNSASQEKKQTQTAMGRRRIHTNTHWRSGDWIKVNTQRTWRLTVLTEDRLQRGNRGCVESRCGRIKSSAGSFLTCAPTQVMTASGAYHLPGGGGGAGWDAMHWKSVADSSMNSTHRSLRRAAGITIKPLALVLDRTWNAECKGRPRAGWRHDCSCVSITLRITQNLSIAIKKLRFNSY